MLADEVQIQWECQQLLNRVVTLTDSHDWQALADCYADDAVLFRPSDASNGLNGKDEIKASFLARPPRTTCHLLCNCVFDVVNSDLVSASSRVLLIAGDVVSDLPVIADPGMLTGRFADTLVRIDRKWLIKRREGSIDLKYDYSLPNRRP